jgi:hypothetical protein
VLLGGARADLTAGRYDRKEAIRSTIASMTLGKDVSALFPDIIKNMVWHCVAGEGGREREKGTDARRYHRRPVTLTRRSWSICTSCRNPPPPPFLPNNKTPLS